MYAPSGSRNSPALSSFRPYPKFHIPLPPMPLGGLSRARGIRKHRSDSATSVASLAVKFTLRPSSSPGHSIARRCTLASLHHPVTRNSPPSGSAAQKTTSTPVMFSSPGSPQASPIGSPVRVSRRTLSRYCQPAGSSGSCAAHFPGRRSTHGRPPSPRPIGSTASKPRGKSASPSRFCSPNTTPFPPRWADCRRPV